MVRLLAAASACAFVILASVEAAADTVAITTGNAGLYWDASQTSASVSSADSQFISEYFGSPSGRRSPDGSLDFSRSIPFTNAGNHPLSQTYRGQKFSNAWISGSMSIVTNPVFLPPAIPEGTVQSFETSFTMTGTITAYATSDRTGVPLFSTDMTGGGTYTAGPYRVVNGTWVRVNSGADTLSFTPARSVPYPWQSVDVGVVGARGYAYQGPDGDLYMGGAGSDIWGTADSFRFVYQSILDGEISALVGAEDNVHPFAKTGVMLRRSLDPGSPEVILDVKPDGGVEFMTRAAQGGETTFISGTSVPVQPVGGGSSVTIYATLQLVRSRGVVTASVCSRDSNHPGDTAICKTVGSTPFGSGPALIGVAVTSHNPAVLNNAYFPAALPRVSTVPSPWYSYDVGPASQLHGDAFFENDTFTVRGSGADIWGTADAFHFVRQCLVDDGELVARVTSEQNADTFGKAGVLIEDNGPTVILDVRPNGFVEFMSRPSAGAQMAFLAGAASSFPAWLKLARVGDEFSGSISDDGTNWRLVGTTTVPMHRGTCIEGGLAVTSHDVTALNTSTFDHVSVVSQAFVDGDVGDVGAVGTVAYESGGLYNLYGAGADIWGTADAFNFLARGMFGDGQIVTRVVGLDDSDTFAKAGLMIRESTDPSAAHVILDVRPGGQIEFMTRPASGDSTAFIAGSTMALPGWLKLTRSGSLISGFSSTDGQNWNLIGTTTLSIPADALQGLVVTSHRRGVLNHASFDNVSR